MGNPYFRFRHFTVWHDRCAMKVGTDGVLLGAWTEVCPSGEILDVGTGSGLIALMIAQRSLSARITGIEPDPEAAAQAAENFRNSEWAMRLNAVNLSLQSFARTCGTKFRLIVSNPPYYDCSLINSDGRRTAARHTDTLSHKDLLHLSSRLMEDGGILSLIIPAEYADKVIEAASAEGLGPERICTVRAREHSRERRAMISFKKEQDGITRYEEFFIYEGNGEYSGMFKSLTEEFYL